MKALTDFRKTVETGVDPRLLTDLKPLFIPLAALALKCYECSEDPGSVGKCSGAKIGQIGNKTCVPLLNRCSTVRYTLKGTSLTALSCANSAGCDPLSQYSCKLKYQSFYRLIYLILTRNCHRFILRCTCVILSTFFQLSLPSVSLALPARVQDQFPLKKIFPLCRVGNQGLKLLIRTYI